MTVGGQTAISYTYDTADRLTAITQGTGSVGFTYDVANRTTQVTLPNNLAMVYAYDNANQLTGITYKQASTTLGDVTYTYDTAGRRTTVGGTWARSGLPVAATAASITLNVNNQALTFAGTTITYDLNGNLATAQDASGTATYSWDVRNRLTGLTSPGFSASFAYDSLGRRTGKTVQGVTTNFVYDGVNPVQEKNGATVTANLLTGLGIDEFLTRTDGTGIRALATEALGSTVAVTDNTGTIQTQYTYEPFGFTTSSGQASTNSYKYTGREDDGTGLYYYRARYYSPRLQRFLSEDPLEFAGEDVNLYNYVFNNPINYVDPDGLFSNSAGGGRGTGRNNGPTPANPLPESGRIPEYQKDFFDALKDWAKPEALQDLDKIVREDQRIQDFIKQKNLEGQPVDLLYDKNKQLMDVLSKKERALCSLGGCKLVPYPKPKPISTPSLPVNKPLNKRK